jgi:hypothetical protein
MSRRYERDELAAQLNTTFQIHFTPDIVKDAELISVSDVVEIGNFESFTITFLITDECPIYQHIYQIDHAEIGNMELFLVPSGKDQKGTTYVSTFSYLKE